jgi:predicted porin
MQTTTTRLLVWSALCALSTTAFAQSSVTFYGIVDTGIEYVSHANEGGGQ